MIDGVFVRGLYLSNPKQQEIVVDYFRNLLGSIVFEVDPNKQSEVIKPSTPTNTEWAYPYELRLKLRQPFGLAMNWFQQNRFLGIFLGGLAFATLLSACFLFHEKSAADREQARLETTINELTRLRRSTPFPSEENLRKTKAQTDSYRDSAARAEERVEDADVSKAAAPA